MLLLLNRPFSTVNYRQNPHLNVTLLDKPIKYPVNLPKLLSDPLYIVVRDRLIGTICGVFYSISLYLRVDFGFDHSAVKQQYLHYLAENTDRH